MPRGDDLGEDLGWGTSVEESTRIIDRYLELGGNFIDTADLYTKSHSEKILGDHVGRYPARRDRIVLATRFSGNLYPGDPNGGGSGRRRQAQGRPRPARRLLPQRAHLPAWSTRSKPSRAPAKPRSPAWLAWVQAQPGVSSTIIGARTLAQLEDNLRAADLQLDRADLAQLDELTKPTFGFPQSMQPMFPAIHNGGTTVNGLYAPPSEFGLQKGAPY